MQPLLNDTICAIATASGEGAISIIRVSGEKAFETVQTVFEGKYLREQNGNTVHFGKILDEQQSLVDEVLVSVFKNPKSYTGEDLIEISCHGSSFIQQKIIQLLLKQGVRLANRGEFTMRAFLNGKLNLSQAEAVADLIASEHEAQHKVALQQMRGGFQADLKHMREDLIQFAALLELELDFSEEDVEFANREQLKKLLQHIQHKLSQLKDSFYYGNAIKQGVSTVIAGRPNAGKSTLLNALLNEERALVSAIPGTTRDTIEESLVLNGIRFRFVDTAGIRQDSTDEIENMGIQKTLEHIEKAHVLLYLFDLKNTTLDQVLQDVEVYRAKGLKLVLVGNKVDLISTETLNIWKTKLHEDLPEAQFISISAREKQHLTDLKNTLTDFYTQSTLNPDQSLVSNVRHYEALTKALDALKKSTQGLDQGISSDFIAMDIRQTLHHIGTITGEVDVDTDILGTIFSKFCIGK